MNTAIQQLQHHPGRHIRLLTSFHTGRRVGNYRHIRIWMMLYCAIWQQTVHSVGWRPNCNQVLYNNNNRPRPNTNNQTTDNVYGAVQSSWQSHFRHKEFTRLFGQCRLRARWLIPLTCAVSSGVARGGHRCMPPARVEKFQFCYLCCILSYFQCDI